MSNRALARDMQVEFQARVCRPKFHTKFTCANLGPLRILNTSKLTGTQFQAKQARREAQKAAKQDPILKKQIQDVRC